MVGDFIRAQSVRIRHALFVLMIFAAATPVRASTWAEGLFEELSYDFGTVPHGVQLSHPFWIVNNTKTPVRIAVVRVSSGGPTARALQNTLEPGQKSAIAVGMDTWRFNGAKVGAIYVQFDQPGRAEVKLTVKADSKEGLVYEPDCIDFGTIKRGITATGHMTVTFRKNPEIHVTEAKCARDFVRVNVRELSRKDGKVVYQVAGTIQGIIPVGNSYVDIWLTTDDASMPKLRVPLMVESEPPVVKVKISGPEEAPIDKPITFKVEVRNIGTKTTAEDFSLIVHTGSSSDGKKINFPIGNLPEPASKDFVFDLPGKKFQSTLGGWNSDFAKWDGHHLPVGSIPPNGTRTLTFAMTPRRAKLVQISVYDGLWRQGTNHPVNPSALIPISEVATARVQVKFDPKTPLDALLPQPPRAADRGARLPKTLAEVPEVFFQEPLAKKSDVADAMHHTARVIDRIHHLNAKNADGFVIAMLSKRADLAGLPFIMGDDCRMKPTESRQFAAALGAIRGAREPAGSLKPSSGPGFTVKTPEHSKLIEAYQMLLAKAIEKSDAGARVASLMQVLGPESAADRHGLARYLAGESHVAATRALAKLAIFSEEPRIRAEAIGALKERRKKDYTDILLSGLNYPWPDVAAYSSDAIARLGRTDLIPELIDVLARPDPRAPQVRESAGKKATVVREVVRVNHLHNCLLCHAPVASDTKMTTQESEEFAKLTAQVPVPGEALTAYYRPSNPDILVRFDVTYLRQDFSMNLAVPDADPWPNMQRYDFLVRNREVTTEDAKTLEKLFQSEAPSVYQLAVHAALRELTGVNAQPTAAAWSEALRK
jgi:hypothetical protein